MSCSVIKIFILGKLKMLLQKYKIDVILMYYLVLNHFYKILIFMD